MTGSHFLLSLVSLDSERKGACNSGLPKSVLCDIYFFEVPYTNEEVSTARSLLYTRKMLVAHGSIGPCLIHTCCVPCCAARLCLFVSPLWCLDLFCFCRVLSGFACSVHPCTWQEIIPRRRSSSAGHRSSPRRGS